MGEYVNNSFNEFNENNEIMSGKNEYVAFGFYGDKEDIDEALLRNEIRDIHEGDKYTLKLYDGGVLGVYKDGTLIAGTKGPDVEAFLAINETILYVKTEKDYFSILNLTTMEYQDFNGDGSNVGY